MSKIKSSLKNKEGMSLPGVLAIFAILCLFSSAMYLMAMTSLREVRYSSEQKKAEYLAQAGVEASAYAYQAAVNNRDRISEYGSFISATSNDKNSEITTNKVYMVWIGADDEKYRFVTESDLGSYSAENIIGYYIAKLTNKDVVFQGYKKFYYEEGNGQPPKETNEEIDLPDSIKIIEATGYSYNGNATQKKMAYIPNPKQALGAYYGDDGIIDGGNGNFINVGTFKTASELTLKFKNTSFLNKWFRIEFDPIVIPIPGGAKTIDIQMAYCAGNMILGQPNGKNVDALSLKKNADNIVIFTGMNDLFVETGIDVEPSSKYFNYLLLRGNNIVVNGNIEIYAYGFTRNTKTTWAGNIGTMADVIAGKFRLGTVVIGTPSRARTTVTDPVKNNSVYNFGDCGRIYFGGDVFVNIEFPNVGTYRYKAFSAGDAYYFNDDLTKTVSETDMSMYGIDLLKYFLDKSIAEKKYSVNVLQRFEDLINTYYNAEGSPDSTTYVIGDDDGNIIMDSMRKIDRDKFSQDKFSDLIPPDPTGASTLIWEDVKG